MVVSTSIVANLKRQTHELASSVINVASNAGAQLIEVAKHLPLEVLAGEPPGAEIVTPYRVAGKDVEVVDIDEDVEEVPVPPRVDPFLEAGREEPNPSYPLFVAELGIMRGALANRIVHLGEARNELFGRLRILFGDPDAIRHGQRSVEDVEKEEREKEREAVEQLSVRGQAEPKVGVEKPPSASFTA